MIHRLEARIEQDKRLFGKLNACLLNSEMSDRYASLMRDTAKRDTMTRLARFRALRHLVEEYTAEYAENMARFAALKMQRDVLASCLGDADDDEYPEKSMHMSA